jgi:hypothetical protein
LLRPRLAGAFIAVGQGGGSRTAPTGFDKMSMLQGRDRDFNS